MILCIIYIIYLYIIYIYIYIIYIYIWYIHIIILLDYIIYYILYIIYYILLYMYISPIGLMPFGLHGCQEQHSARCCKQPLPSRRADPPHGA
jgi:hypothetical protein